MRSHPHRAALRALTLVSEHQLTSPETTLRVCRHDFSNYPRTTTAVPGKTGSTGAVWGQETDIDRRITVMCHGFLARQGRPAYGIALDRRSGFSDSGCPGSVASIIMSPPVYMATW